MLEVALEGAGVLDLESLLFVLEAEEICEMSGSCDAISNGLVLSRAVWLCIKGMAAIGGCK